MWDERVHSQGVRDASAIREAELAGLWGASQRSFTGRYVTPETAMTLSTVYRCMQVLADSIAQLPLVLYRRVDEDMTCPRCLSHRLC